MDSDNKEDAIIQSKKNEIKQLTQYILDLGNDVSKNKVEIKEKMRSVISLVGYVISNANTNPETNKNPLTDFSINVFQLIDSYPEQNDSILTYLKLFGSFANNLVDALSHSG
jgi:hypothetical protein